MPQSLKETFADKIPGEIEKVKKLRKCVPFFFSPLTPPDVEQKLMVEL